MILRNVNIERWLGLRLESTGSLAILFVSLYAIIRKDQMSAGIAGLSLSYAITVSMNYTILCA